MKYLHKTITNKNNNQINAKIEGQSNNNRNYISS